MNHYITKSIINRLYSVMREQNISTTYICKQLGINYPNFVAMLEGKTPCYNKWQRKICTALNVDREWLFREFMEEQ